MDIKDMRIGMRVRFLDKAKLLTDDDGEIAYVYNGDVCATITAIFDKDLVQLEVDYPDELAGPGFDGSIEIDPKEYLFEPI